MNVVIIGGGVVGVATSKTLKVDCDFYDPDLGFNADYRNADVVFICTPTENAKSYIDELLDHPNVFVRSSIPFTWIKDTNIAMYPEFLTQRTWQVDCLNPFAIVVGCNSYQLDVLQQISKFNMNDAYIVDNATAALMKISTNALASIKVTFMNYLFDLCTQHGLNYNSLVETILQDPRVGSDHMSVPGPDGMRGFGGKCFPENCQVLIDLCGGNKLIEVALEENKRFRK